MLFVTIIKLKRLSIQNKTDTKITVVNYTKTKIIVLDNNIKIKA